MLMNSALPSLETSIPDTLPLDRVAVIILGGGEGKRLHPLTSARCKPAVSFAGRYTLIDIPISHSISSGLSSIYVIGQYLADSLRKHLQEAYGHFEASDNKIHFLEPKNHTYEGTADAVRKNLELFKEIKADYFLILSGDHLYNINFQEMIRFGISQDAALVIAAQPIAKKEASRMGVLKLESGSTKVIDFVEKPSETSVLDAFFIENEAMQDLGFSSHDKNYLASMGLYFFKRNALIELLENDGREDFGKHLIQTQMKSNNVHAYLYDGYWEDIGTIESYYFANLALTEKSFDHKTSFHCYDEKFVIMTKTHHLPGAAIEGTLVRKSVISEGSIIEAEEITHSIIGRRSVIGKGTVIRDCILMGNDHYNPTIGTNCFISKAIIDENVHIGHDVHLTNKEGHHHYDSPPNSPAIHVRDGILIVPKGTTVPDGFVF